MKSSTTIILAVARHILLAAELVALLSTIGCAAFMEGLSPSTCIEAAEPFISFTVEGGGELVYEYGRVRALTPGDVTIHVHPGTGHAFTNEENALGTYDAEASAAALAKTLELFASTLR